MLIKKNEIDYIKLVNNVIKKIYTKTILIFIY